MNRISVCGQSLIVLPSVNFAFLHEERPIFEVVPVSSACDEVREAATRPTMLARQPHSGGLRRRRADDADDVFREPNVPTTLVSLSDELNLCAQPEKIRGQTSQFATQ